MADLKELVMLTRYLRSPLRFFMESWADRMARKRRLDPEWTLDLRRADLSNAVLRDLDLSGSCLSEANLFDAVLSGADLSNADLRGATISDATLFKTDLRSAQLCKANLSDADLSNADLTDANLSDANLMGARLTSAKLVGADLSGANLRGSDLTYADLSNACLTNTDFQDAVLIESVLNNSDLTGALITRRSQSGAGSGGSYLDLATCIGLESATFGSSQFLMNYLEEAFEYALSPSTCDADRWPSFVEEALARISYLNPLLKRVEEEPPPLLVEALDKLTADLILYLRRNPKQLHEIPPRMFEELVAEILASFGWQVDLTPKTRDGGYDIFALSPNSGASVSSSWIIECKRYAVDRPVGVGVVRALYGSNAFLQKEAGMKMLATTSRFTKGVYDLQASKYDLALKDYEGILDWLNTYRPNPSGTLYLPDSSPSA